ncbi:MAG: carboxypeptidase regulatory-like domain-containing protein [Candidatus Sumerlaeaceae bacterium]|nr:carboxypeptidase regulatory-like domain-containing protein [Candidatus Sumerlaeaceae bacterium]
MLPGGEIPTVIRRGLTLLLVAVCGAFVLAACGSGRRGSSETPALGEIAGQALLADGGTNGHAGILVYLGGTSFSARTDEFGSYRMTGVPRGQYSVMAEKPGYQTVSLGRAEVDPAVHTGPNPLVIQTAILERADNASTAPPAQNQLGGIRGALAVMGARSGEGVRVAVEGTPLVTVTDEAGYYQFFNVEPGAYVLELTKSGYRRQQVSVRVSPGQTAQVRDLIMEPETEAAPAAELTPAVARLAGATLDRAAAGGNRSITGLVTAREPGGTPITDFKRVSVSIDNSDYVISPDSTGRFEFNGLPPGVYTVIAVLDEGQPVTKRVDLVAAATASVEFALGGPGGQPEGEGTVTGRVVLAGPNGESGPSAEGVTIGLAGTNITALTGRDGAFRLAKVPAATYSLVAAKDGYTNATVDGVEVGGGQTVDVGEIVLEPKLDYPRVISTSPADGTRDVVVGQKLLVRVKFSKRMNADTVRGAVSIQPETNFRTFMGPGSHPQADDSTLVIELDNMDEQRPIKFRADYVIRIAQAAADTDGLRMKEDYSFRFTTGAPGIIGTRPADGEVLRVTGEPTRPIIVYFNTRIRHESLKERTVRIRPDTDILPNIICRDDPRTGWTTAEIEFPLQGGEQYTVTIGRGVRAFNNQSLANTPYQFSFRTETLRREVLPPRIHR